MSEFNQAKYIQEYQKEKYDRCIFNVQKGQKSVIEKHFKSKGYKSLNTYINALIKADMENEEQKVIPTGLDTNKLNNLQQRIHSDIQTLENLKNRTQENLELICNMN